MNTTTSMNRPPLRLRTTATLFALALVAATLDAQVNTEAMRHDDAAPGLHNRITFDAAYQAGNNTFLSIGAGYRLDFRADRLYTFLVADYDRGSGNDELFENDGFAHARLIWMADSVVRPEIFVQKEFNDFILLRDRSLAGGGLRLRVIDARDSSMCATIDVGVGAMYEVERIATAVEERTQLLRSTNYISCRLDLSPIIHLFAAGYFQIAPAQAHDYRILSEGSLAVNLSTVLAFTTSLHYRYDNLPPAGIKNYDLKITNGLAVTF